MQISIVTRLDALSCTDLSDAMDRLKIVCQCTDIMPLDRSFNLTGKAWTLRYGPIGLDGGSVGDYIDDLEAGQVVVIDNQARLDTTVWGDLLTSTAARKQLAGTVIDGICRDVDRALELNYPIFSRGTGCALARIACVSKRSRRPLRWVACGYNPMIGCAATVTAWW